MAGVFLEIFRPFILPRASSLNNNLERTSMPRINKKGKRGSPCLRPLLGENKPKWLPLIRKEKKEEEMHKLIHLIQTGWKPSFSITTKTKSHSILSKAFSMSMFRNINPHFPILLWKVCKSL